MSVFIWDVCPVQATGAPGALASGIKVSQGTFVCNGNSNVTITDANILTTSQVIISLNTVGGTVGALPKVTTLTAGTSFTVAGTALDTSTYNYTIINFGVTASEAP
jgi:hypothetical protein